MAKPEFASLIIFSPRVRLYFRLVLRFGQTHLQAEVVGQLRTMATEVRCYDDLARVRSSEPLRRRRNGTGPNASEQATKTHKGTD